MQENTKSVVVKMTARRCFRTEPIWQYDGGHVLTFEGFELPMSFEVHFSRSPMGNAIPQIGTNGVCTVPEMFTQNAGVIYAWLYIADTDSRLTKYSIEIPVAKRAKPTNQEPTPVEQSAIDQAIAALNAGVERSETAADAAESAQEAAEGYAEAAGNSAITATNAATSAAASAGNAASSATAAASSATDANASREAADQSATNAGISERNAAASASAAASSASSAAQNAFSASGSASSASESAGAAVAAKGAAETAQAAAESVVTTVTESAADAAESASTATGAATNAAASAADASSSATAAAGSATAAAGSAQTAQDVLDSIPEDYSELSGDVNSLMSAITELEPKVDSLEINKADVIISSASGAIASFSDGADDMPVKSLSVAIEPVQDLHGYDHPWPAGGGKNLFDPDISKHDHPVDVASTAANDPSDLVFTDREISGTVTVNARDFCARCSEIYPAGTYTVTYRYVNGVKNYNWKPVIISYSNSDGWYSFATDIGVAASYTVASSDSGDNAFTFTTTTDFYVNITLNSFGAAAETAKNKIVDLQIVSGSTASSWTPYSNICPISGWDAVKVTRTGKNLAHLIHFGGSSANFANLTDNSVTVYSTTSSAAYRYARFSLAETDGIRGQTVNFHCNITNDTGNSPRTILRIIDSDGNYIRNIFELVTLSIDYSFTIPSDLEDGCKLIAILYSSSGYSGEQRKTWSDIQLELGYTATDYEPYAGQTYSITLPSEAGTVYGGSLTVNKDGTGTLVVDRAKIVFDGSQTVGSSNWRANEESVGWLYQKGITPNAVDAQTTAQNLDDVKCDRLEVVSYGSGLYNGTKPSLAWVGADWGFGMRVNDTSLTTVAAINAWLSANPVTVVYKLATPQTFTLTASQVQTILGTNNIWADSGDVAVSYRADTKLYIDNKITQAIAAALNA